MDRTRTVKDIECRLPEGKKEEMKAKKEMEE